MPAQAGIQDFCASSWIPAYAGMSGNRIATRRRSPRRRREEIGIKCPRRRNELSQQPRRYGADWIDRDAGGARRSDRLIVDSNQPLFVATAKEQSDDRNLPEHIVEAVERHEGPAQMNVIACVVDIPFYGCAYERSPHDAVANRHLSRKTGKVRAHLAEINSARPRSVWRS